METISRKMGAAEREAKAFIARRGKRSTDPTKGEPDGEGAPRGWAAARAWLRGSAWMPLAGKALTWAAAFVALAAVGSGAAVQFLPGSGDSHLASLIGSPTRQAEQAPHEAPTARATETATHPAEIGAGATDAGAPAPDGGPPSGGVTGDGKVILNLATEDDLRRLSGIGPAKAKSILALRAKLGRFKRVEDLLRVKGIGRKRLARLRPLVVLDPP